MLYMVEMAPWRSAPMVIVTMVLLFVLQSGVVQGGALSEPKEAEDGIVLKSRTKRAITTDESNITDQDGKPSGAVYTRWGRHDCPDDAHLLYNGVIAAGCSNPMQMLCLANNPTWYPNQTTFYDQHLNPQSTWHLQQTIMCGAEYVGNLLNVEPEENAECAVCQIGRRTQMMIPGRNTCVHGWRLEYQGYLMVNLENMGVSPICVDRNPSADRSGAGPGGQTVHLNHAVPNCESLPCPPYNDGKAITCVVCSHGGIILPP